MIGDDNLCSRVLGFIVMKASAIVATIAIYFLIYWLLPNGKVPVRAVLPAAIITGVVSEAAKYIYILVLPWLNFQEVYGPFSVSVTLIFWSFWSGMLLLGGAYLLGCRTRQPGASTARHGCSRELSLPRLYFYRFSGFRSRISSQHLHEFGNLCQVA